MRFIGLILGRFQGVTNAHEKLIQRSLLENEITFVYIINGSQTKGNPFDFEFRKSLIASVFGERIKIRQAKTANLDKIGDEIIQDLGLSPQEEKSHLSVYCGEDRSSGYGLQLKYINGFDKNGVDMTGGKKNILIASIIYIPRPEHGISATQVRQLILENNKKAFSRQTPKPTWIYYQKMREILRNHEAL